MNERLSATGDAARPRDGSWEGWFLLLFVTQSAVCLAGIIWLELAHNTGDGWLETAIAVIRGMEAVVVVVGVWTFTVMEGAVILGERYLRKRFESGRAVGLQEGLQEGREEGREETMTEWVTWNGRRLEAERRGEPFDEPPPSENGASGR